MATERVVVGGGLFGCFSALVLASRGCDVLVIEQGPELLSRASMVNQARLHSGLHYPRSLLTAKESAWSYQKFLSQWPEAVRHFEQIYAVAIHNTKTSGDDFQAFIERLGVSTEEIDPDRWFHPSTVARAFRVEEPSFDVKVLRDLLAEDLCSRSNVTVRLDSAVIGGSTDASGVTLHLSTGEKV